MRRILCILICVSMFSMIFAAMPVSANSEHKVDLSTWTAESYPAVSGFPIGVWTVSTDHTSVYQSNNGQPTMFYSDFLAFGTEMQGTIKVTGTDDDLIGFALGFQPGDSSNTNADYLLIDWKRGTQYYNFGTPSCGPGGTAYIGLAVSHVEGVPNADEFWHHVDQDVTCSPLGQGVTELARATNLGSTGWVIGQEYIFKFEFTSTSLKVYVDGVLEIDITGDFQNGRVAFYNFSQAGVTYSGFTLQLEAVIDIDPDTLNSKSNGQWITCYIELPEGYDVANIDVSTILLNDIVPAESEPTEIGDYDTDGIPDLMVKFDRAEVLGLVGETNDYEEGIKSYDFTLTVTGELLDGSTFEGQDTVKVLSK
ncbi:MAG: hypothetical protein JSV56_00780 [Methanomassiliicoccales archaeon]|nr:MAG: hypothetical protein JSV56_00780 [Methanomassiliicoccales archaeon]